MAYETFGIQITADGSIATTEFQRLDGVISGVTQRIAASAATAQRELATMAGSARNSGRDLAQAFSSLKIQNSADIVAQAQAIRSALNQIRGSGTASEITRATEAARQQMAKLRQEFDATGRKVREVSAATNEAGGFMSGISGKLGLGGGAAAAAGLAALVAMALKARDAMIEAQQSSQKLNNALGYSVGKAGVAGELEYLRNVTQQLGLDFASTSAAYAKFAAATKGSGISLAQTKTVFEGISVASAQMGLSADETQGALLALSQMASKGVVNAEELRGQLGERLPGAFKIAAQAMGVTTAELGKMLERGQIMASDFLPKFGEALKNEFQAPLTSVTQELNRFNSAWDIWKREISEGTSVTAVAWLTRSLNESAAAMRSLGKEAGIAQKLLIGIGGLQMGLVGKGHFDSEAVQKEKLKEIEKVAGYISSLEGRNLTYLEQGRLDNLRMQKAQLKKEIESLGVDIGKKLPKIDKGMLAEEFEAQNRKQNERLKTYIDDVKNAPKAVKIAAEVETENKAFQTAVAGLSETDKRYVEALKAHQARVNEIKQRGIEKGSAGNDAAQTFAARMAAEKDFTKTAVDLVKDRVAQQLISEREGIDQTLAAQEQGFVRQAKLLKEQLAATKDAGDREKVKQQILALGNEAARADSGAAAARAKIDRKSTDLLDDYKRGNELVLERIQREAELALMNERQRAVAQALYKVEDDGQKIRERIIRDITDETERTRALASVDALLAEQKEKVAAATEKSIDSQRTFEFGWRKAFQSYSDEATNAAKTAGDAFTGFTGAMEGAIKSFVKTGKLDMQSFRDAVINTLIDIQMQSMKTNVLAPFMAKAGGFLASAFGFGGATTSGAGTMTENWIDSGGLLDSAKGNAFSGVPALSSYSGSVVDRPTIFPFARGAGLMGEAGPEGIFPLKRGADGKLGVSAEGAGATSVVINVDAGGSKVEGDAGNARELGRRIENAVRGVLMAEQRPGGMLA